MSFPCHIGVLGMTIKRKYDSTYDTFSSPYKRNFPKKILLPFLLLYFNIDRYLTSSLLELFWLPVILLQSAVLAYNQGQELL